MCEKGVDGCSMFSHLYRRTVTFSQFETKSGENPDVEDRGLGLRAGGSE